MKPSVKYEETLLKELRDPEEAAAYLNAALEDAITENDHRLFLIALRDVTEAHGMTAISSSAKLNRVSMYRMLSEKGNPEFSSLWSLLDSVGLRLAIGVK